MLPPEACTAGMADIEYTKHKLTKLGEICTQLTARACSDLGEETETCKMVQEQTPDFPPDKCKEMLDNYDTVISELRGMETANKPLDEATQQRIAGSDAPAFGPADAKVTLVEFSDFQCPYCSKAAETVHQVQEKYGDKVRLVFRQFPLSFHANAHGASQAALAAHQQGKFWQYHDLLFANQSALTREDLEKYAEQLNLNMGPFRKALDSETYKEAVDGDLELGKLVAVNGTPTIFLNGKRVGNVLDFATLQAEIDTALAAK
ncbi:MAG: thioredoxin domain-containing protein [Nannocystaceae bacterium]